MKRLTSLILTLLLLALPFAALAEGVVSYTPDFYVADYANVLDDEVEGLIVLNNDRLDKACGAQIVVVTVDTVGSMTLENYAYKLFNEWGIGAEGKNNGLLILLAIGDGGYWLMPGKGLQDYLTAGDLDELAVEHLIPPAQEGNYSLGVRQMFAACFEKVAIAYNAGVELDETLYYDWLQTSSSDTYLDAPVREMPQVQEQVPPAVEQPVSAPQEAPARSGGGFSFIWIIVILVVIVVVIRAFGTVRTRPGRSGHVPPPPPRPAPRPPVPPRAPMGGVPPRPPVTPRPPMGGAPHRPPVTPRPPMGGMNAPRPAARPSAPARNPMGGPRMGGGGMTRGGGMGGSIGRSAVSRPSRPSGGSRPGGGFGGGRSGGGGMTRGGGSGGSFGGRR